MRAAESIILQELLLRGEALVEITELETDRFTERVYTKPDVLEGRIDTKVGSAFSRTLLGLLFVLAGALHFRAPGTYEQIMPPYLPLHRELVYLSGILEIAGGLGLFTERTRPVAGIGLILLLIAVLPANVQMLLDARAAEEPVWWVALLWARLPLQLVLIAWVWRASHLRT